MLRPSQIFTLFMFVLIFIVPWDQLILSSVHLGSEFLSPSAENLLGTDHVGRDLLVRVHNAFWQGVLPVWGSVVAAFLLSVSLVVLIDFQRGFLKIVDRFISPFLLAIKSFPIIVGILLFAAYFERFDVVSVCLFMFLFTFSKFYLDLKSEYFKDSKLLYWTYYDSIGGSEKMKKINYGLKGLWRDKVVHSLLMLFQTAVVVEASVAYLGMGVSEPNASFGNILSVMFSEALKGRSLQLLIIIGCMIIVVNFPKALSQLAISAYIQFTGQAQLEPEKSSETHNSRKLQEGL